jgi:hypothetical protein
MVRTCLIEAAMNRRQLLLICATLPTTVSASKITMDNANGTSEKIEEANKSEPAKLNALDTLILVGRLRMFSQRVCRAFGQVAASTMLEQSRQILQHSIRMYARTLESLHAQESDVVSLPDLLAEQRALWPRIRGAVNGAAVPSSVQLVQGLSEDLLRAAQTATEKALVDRNTAHLVAIETACRQRAYTERVGKLVAFENALNLPGLHRGRFEDTGRHMDQAMASLSAHEFNDEAIRQSLRKANVQWRALRQLVRSGVVDDRAAHAVAIAQACEALLQTQDGLHKHYVRLAIYR